MYERRRLERRLRDKEAAYQEVCAAALASLAPGSWRSSSLCFQTLKRLKNWEIRERKKFRDYSKDAEREDERRRETVSDANRASAC